MSAAASLLVCAGDALHNHMQGQAAAEQFLQSLRRYAMTGAELERVIANAAFMPPEKAAAWNRGFYARIQKACQRAVDIAP